VFAALLGRFGGWDIRGDHQGGRSALARWRGRRAEGCRVKQELAGHAVLIVEDEPLVALDIANSFRKAGASVLTASNVQEGLRLAGHHDLSAAVVDFGLHDGEATALCRRLKERSIPFILHSGYSHVCDDCRAGVVMSKPAYPVELVATVIRLVREDREQAGER
jgi:DNA-binding response OmpR family regulator